MQRVFLNLLNNPKFGGSQKLKILIGIHPGAAPMTNLPKKMVGTASSLQKWSYKVWYPLRYLHDLIFPVGLLAIYISEYGHVIHCWKGIEQMFSCYQAFFSKFCIQHWLTYALRTLKRSIVWVVHQRPNGPSMEATIFNQIKPCIMHIFEPLRKCTMHFSAQLRYALRTSKRSIVWVVQQRPNDLPIEATMFNHLKPYKMYIFEPPNTKSLNSQLIRGIHGLWWPLIASTFRKIIFSCIK